MLKRFAVASSLALALASLAAAQVINQPGPPTIAGCAYNATVPTPTDALGFWVQCDSGGALRVSPQATAAAGSGAAYTSSAALVANQVVKGSAGNLYSFEVSADSTLSGAAWWIMVYDATAAPADGAVTPAKCYALASGTTSYSAAFPTPIAFATGITIGVSTTGCFSKTASVHAFISGDAK